MSTGWRPEPAMSSGAAGPMRRGVFVIGDQGAIFHFDGVSWERQLSPAPVPLHAIWGVSRTRLWAVGWMGVILSFDGHQWRQIQGCVVGQNGKYTGDDENTPLFAIDGTADGRAWAVGDRGRILHFDGTTWDEETSGTRAHLRSVVCLDDGTVLVAGGDGTVLRRGADTQWQKLDCPVASNFVSILPLDADSILLAGGRYFVDANGFRGDLVLHDETGFRKLFADEIFSRFRALARHGEAVIAVGDGGQIHRIDNQRLRRVASGTQHDLLGIVALPGDEAMAVGRFRYRADRKCGCAIGICHGSDYGRGGLTLERGTERHRPPALGPVDRSG